MIACKAFTHPTEALRTLKPDLALRSDLMEQIRKELMAAAGVAGEAAEVAFVPDPLIVALAGSACVDFVMGLRPDLSRSRAAEFVEAANSGWFSRSSYLRNTNRIRKKARKRIEDRAVLHPDGPKG